MTQFEDEEVVAERMILMQKLNKNMRSANALIKENKLDLELIDVFSHIENIFKKYPSLFPDDSFAGKTKASTDIITNRSTFNAISSEHQQNANLAIEAVKSGNTELVTDYFQKLYSSCKSCHSRFRN